MNRFRRVALASTIAVVLGLTAGCGGDDGKATRQGQLKALETLPQFIQDDFSAGDTNGDGRIQDTELTVMVEEDFKASDVNKDGEISGADIEMEAGKGADVKTSLAGMDIDEDGRVPLEEYAQHVERDFMKQMDTNKDGHLDPTEVAKFYERQYEGRDAK